MLIYNPSSLTAWLTTPPPALAKLGREERAWQDLAAGIVTGEGAMRTGMSSMDVARLSVPTALFLPTADAVATQWWEFMRDYAGYARLLLSHVNGKISVSRVDGALWQCYLAELSGAWLERRDYLYEPHPAVMLQGRYVEVFAPTDPDALICACALGEGGWDKEEEKQVAVFRTRVLELIWQVVAEAEVTFIDMDSWYAEDSLLVE